MQDKNEEAIFSAAIELDDPAERARLVAQACGDDRKLRADVEALLRSHDSRSLLDVPPLDSGPLADQGPLTEGPGTVIGRYKLLEKIGEGGMAVVYMAEQQEPIRRKVALKIIKLGMDTRQVIARFEAERQALALMDHPSIAKVLDAGATETGRPYFVMELVQGVSITEYCDKNSLSTKDRLGLFLQVCHAVQHAHQKGIIHRDIKPSNVMVTHHDGKPVPKVIDFGIAKATNQRLTEKTLFTRYAHLIGTPAYMSPEQAELSDLDIDTRSDIYSLGVLLYELLTGTTPFSEEELRKAGYIEMQRVIREREPVKPSTRIRTATSVARRSSRIGRRSVGAGPRACPALGGHRGPPLPKANQEIGGPGAGTGGTPVVLMGGTPMLREVRGDLDWIVMKTLEKDRARRYETASGLAEDIRRHLDHEPVLARGPGAAYRLQKFLRKHRAQVLAAVVVAVLALAAGVILSLWNRNRLQLAEAEGFRDRGILSQARGQYATGEREAALKTVQPILASPHVGPEAQLLQAGILVDSRHPDEAAALLGHLLQSPRPEIAGAAHSLMARILWEGESPDAETLEKVQEHRREAERLLPKTAEAYFLQAMTALTVKEQLAALDRALRLDSGHYESRRLRAFTYYASRKYDRLKDDALGMTILRPRDPLGYSLHAVAWRELGRYPEAIADLDTALAFTPKEDPKYVDLSIQRSETLLRMGAYERVIAEAPAVETQDFASPPHTQNPETQDLASLRYHVFCALTALGEYDEATALFRQIISPGHEARREFQDWCAKYVFDTLETGRSWRPVAPEPTGVAFLPMVEAEETYRNLSTKAHRVTTDGFSGQWSPDGKKLAFSAGVHGYSGVAIFDPATEETDLLIVPGKDPRWSPDGKYIAFVRDCQTLRLEELATAERENQQRPVTDEEVWLMKSDGTEPRRVARGSWPSWGSDSEHIYYQSRGDNVLFSISIVDRDTEPKRIMKCPNSLLSISPDNQRVAYVQGGTLKIKDLASEELAAECPLPSIVWGVTGWSPTGDEVCLGGSNLEKEKTGLWLYNLQRKELLGILDGQINSACWSTAATGLVFSLGPPYLEIWAADLDAAIPTIEALGPGQTLDEHLHEMVALYTRRIEADPQDAYAHYSRAQYYDYLHDREKANTDMRQFSAILSEGTTSDSRIATPRRLRGVINGPFGYQLAFSVGGRDNGMHVLCVAFGQKGRCEMKVFEAPMLAMSLIGLGVLSGLDAAPAHADFTLGIPIEVGAPIWSSGHDPQGSCFSGDGLELYFSSNRPGGFGGKDIWVAKRERPDAPWGEPVNLGPPVNDGGSQMEPAISPDGLELYFGSWSDWNIRVCKRPSKDAPWSSPEFLGPPVGLGSETGVKFSADGLSLYFSAKSPRSGSYGKLDIYVSTRATTADPWGEPVNLGPNVNTPANDAYPCISSDGRVLFFNSDRPGGYNSGYDIWVTRRVKDRTGGDSWGAPVNCDVINNPAILSQAFKTYPTISPDGSVLYFERGYDMWQSSITPIVDFNADKKVDLVDLVMLIDNWGSDQTLCDIGPMPWGDGKVDIEDLKVFMTEWEKENPPKS